MLSMNINAEITILSKKGTGSIVPVLVFKLYLKKSFWFREN